ncbi:MAG: hypothetical protein ABJB66_04165 [Gemmatimonadaceae bacterium]
MHQFEARVLLMGGQACVLYGAAEYSRDLDLAVMVTPDALPKLCAGLDALNATVIAVPQFDVKYLERGHAVHFSVPDEQFAPLRVDLMSRMRGVDEFSALWNRRTSIALPDNAADGEIVIDVMALEDLVSQVDFWLAELRSPEFLVELVVRSPIGAARSTRPAVIAAITGGDVAEQMSKEQLRAMSADREYWMPLRRELESLRHAARRI